jgi:UDP-N-acetylmuramoylalanine--D-glutamate ligase
MEEYVGAKTNIFRHAPNRCVVLNADCEDTRTLARYANGQVRYFSSKKTRSDFAGLLREGDLGFYLRDGQIVCFDGTEESAVLSVSDILLPGGHNVENYMTAIALTHGMVKTENIKRVATTFGGVEHRLERIRVHRGVTYYNSSIDSTPSRTAAALSALFPKRPIVICGGYDKKIPFEPLAEALCEHAKAVVLTGATAEKIRTCLACTDRVRSGDLPVLGASDFEAAVRLAAEIAEEGDTVLLSPACASFDAFENFMKRGDAFRRIVQSLA